MSAQDEPADREGMITPMSDENPPEPVTLTKPQARRVIAVKVARDVLVTRSVMSSGSVEPGPVIQLATYIILGEEEV